MQFATLKKAAAEKIGARNTTAAEVRRVCKKRGIKVADLRRKQSWMDILNFVSHASVDGLSYIQAKRFANRFKLENLRIEGGSWVADDGGEPYSIDASTFRAAKESGELIAA